MSQTLASWGVYDGTHTRDVRNSLDVYMYVHLQKYVNNSPG